MQKLNDLSRSLTALQPDGTLIAVIEMSLSSWLVAGIVPGVERQPVKKLAVDECALLKLLHRWREEAQRPPERAATGPTNVRYYSNRWGNRPGRAEFHLALTQMDHQRTLSHRRRCRRCHHRRRGRRSVPMACARLIERPDRARASRNQRRHMASAPERSGRSKSAYQPAWE
jgi:hypothetical protein